MMFDLYDRYFAIMTVFIWIRCIYTPTCQSSTENKDRLFRSRLSTNPNQSHGNSHLPLFQSIRVSGRMSFRWWKKCRLINSLVTRNIAWTIVRIEPRKLIWIELLRKWIKDLQHLYSHLSSVIGSNEDPYRNKVYACDERVDIGIDKIMTKDH